MATIAIVERQGQSREDRGWLAWTTAALQRAAPRRFPGIEKVMGLKRSRRRRQTWQEQLTLARSWVRSAHRRGGGGD